MQTTQTRKPNDTAMERALNSRFLSSLANVFRTKRNTAENAWDKLLGDDQVRQFSAGGAASLSTMHRYYNRLVHGNPDKHYLEYFRDKYLAHRDQPIIASFGAGNGHLERAFLDFQFNFSRIDGYELNPRLVESANAKMGERGVTNVRYHVADLNSHAFDPCTIDVGVFFHSLHHVNELEHFLDRVQHAIKDDGVLLLVDYIGPNRLQYTDHQLSIANNILLTIPNEYRQSADGKATKTVCVRQSEREVISDDPSEAIRSADIIPELKKRFDVLEFRSLGGTLLNHVLRGIAQNFDESDPDDVALLESLQGLEQWYERTGRVQPDFVFAVFTPKR